MQMVVCENCRKVYDYDKDEFCTRCGAFNQPGKARLPATRVDGVNEQNHSGSFVHKEVHREKAVRRFTGMDQTRPDKPAGRRSVQTAQIVKWLFWIAAVAVLYYVVLPVLALLLR